MSPTAALVATPGLEAFAGVLADGRAVDPALVAGQRVALVGDPRRVARCAPRIAGPAATLKVFQTDGVWVLPSLGPLDLVTDSVARHLPAGVRRRVVATVAGCHLGRAVPDGWTRRHLTPQVPPTTTSTIRSGRYYACLRRDDVELVGWPIAGVVPAGIRTADGIEHAVDVIVVA